MRFRFRVDDPTQFERRADELINQNGYRVSGFLPYDSVADTGSNRVLGVENRRPGRAEQRDQLVSGFYCASSKLIIDALTGPDENGRFRMERNDDLGQNPRGSTFQSLLHLFCNMTNVPTDVLVFRKGNNATFGTFMYPPDTPVGGWDDVTAFPIRY
jgi:hypothetical protein